MGNDTHFFTTTIWLVLCCLVVCFDGSAGSSDVRSGDVEAEISSSTSNYTIVTSKLTWSRAKNACEGTGGHLVVVNSAQEAGLLEEAVSGLDLPTSHYWIGLESVGDGRWAWLDGSELGYANWDEIGSHEDSGCVALHIATRKWRTRGCRKASNYICERELVCPEGFQWFETSCYRVVSDTLTNGTDARTACAQISTGSHLAFIKSQSEQTFIEELIEAAGVDTSIWFGLTFASDKDHPEWLDGSPLGSFTAWDRYGEFDDNSPCVRLRRDSDYLWNDRSCSLEYGYVCEVEMCPEGFQWFETSCYRVVSDTRTNGIDARTACAQIATGSHLAFIESQSEQTFLKALVEAAGVDTDFWFGLTLESTNEDHPEWLDGSPLGSFTAWDSFGVFDEKEPCVRLRRRSDFLWNDRPCANMFGYICETAERTEDVITTVRIPTPTMPEEAVSVTDASTKPPSTEPAPPPQTKASVFKPSPYNRAAPSGPHQLRSISALSLFRCATYCLQNSNCASFNYHSADGRAKLNSFCELYSMQFPTSELTAKDGYRYYEV